MIKCLNKSDIRRRRRRIGKIKMKRWKSEIERMMLVKINKEKEKERKRIEGKFVRKFKLKFMKIFNGEDKIGEERLVEIEEIVVEKIKRWYISIKLGIEIEKNLEIEGIRNMINERENKLRYRIGIDDEIEENKRRILES